MNEFTGIAVVLTLFVLRFVTPVAFVMATAYLANHWLNRMEQGQQPPSVVMPSGD